MNDPIKGRAVAQASTRINDLSPILDENISLSMNFAVDNPAQTNRASMLQLRDFLLRDFMETMFPVGSIIFRTDAQTPTDLGYRGTWTRQEADISVRSGLDDNSDLGTVSGENAPVVPVPLHSHTNTANSSVNDPGHDHAETYGTGSGKDATGSGSFHGPTRTGSNTTGITVDTTVSIDQAGTDGATLNVTGKHLNGVIWVRTA